MSEVAARADFSAIRYAQCWEDADVLLAGLDVQPGDAVLSIASAGDNTLALLTRHPSRVLALDLNPAQLACLELRVAAYRELAHEELLELIGSTPSNRRATLYQRLRTQLAPSVRAFWDAHPDAVRPGIGAAGKFERYLGMLRRWVIPLIHPRDRIDRLLRGGTEAERLAFYRDHWDGWRWRLLFRLCCSRFVLGRLGRDPSFFAYVQGGVAERLLARTRSAMTDLDPADNPYLQWILTGQHRTALPLALRPEHFDTIRANLDRLEWRQRSLEDHIAAAPGETFDRCNLSNVFEYMSEPNYHATLDRLLVHANDGARFAYWNLFVPRSRPEGLAHRLRPLTDLAARLYRQDRAFFYSRFVVEEVCGA